MRSDWSKEYKAHILFDKIIAETHARHILFSYNNKGILDKKFIEACLKRYGKLDTYTLKKIPYKRYRNWKTTSSEDHFEYLFYIEKKETENVVYECPLNYTGSKSKMIYEIRSNLPESKRVVDVFGGGFNVGINLRSDKAVYNDKNYFLTQLIMSFRETDTYDYLMYTKRIINKFGLEKGNAESYKNARNYYNSLPIPERDPRFLFTLIQYGFQQQIRFNNNHEFNNPAGNRWLNDKMLERMVSFSRRIKEIDVEFSSLDFENIYSSICKDSFVYLDPPYRLTCGVYNDGKRGFDGWNSKHEKTLFDFMDSLSAKGVPLMFSYVNANGGQENAQLNDWLDKNAFYNKVEVGSGQGRYANRQEIIITNYENTSLHNKK